MSHGRPDRVGSHEGSNVQIFRRSVGVATELGLTFSPPRAHRLSHRKHTHRHRLVLTETRANLLFGWSAGQSLVTGIGSFPPFRTTRTRSQSYDTVPDKSLTDRNPSSLDTGAWSILQRRGRDFRTPVLLAFVTLWIGTVSLPFLGLVSSPNFLRVYLGNIMYCGIMEDGRKVSEQTFPNEFPKGRCHITIRQ